MNPFDRTVYQRRLLSMLERTCLMTADPVEDEDGLAPAEFWATVEFWRGEDRGVLGVGASRGFLEEVAAGLLGIEPAELGTEDVDATLMELASIACSQLVELLGGEHRELRYGPPYPGKHQATGGSRFFCSQFESLGESLRVSVAV